MEVILINPPQLELKEPRAYIPLGLAYLGAKLLEEGIEVRVLNLADKRQYDIPEADIYGITFPSACISAVTEIVNKIRSQYPSARLMVGGPHPTVCPEQVRSTLNVDYIVRGEAESIIVDLVKGKYDRGIVEAGIIKDLDSLPFPARELFDPKDVVNLTGIHGSDKPSTTVITSRGCPYACSFCCKRHLMYRLYRYRSPDNVVKELEELISTYSIEHIRFVDDIFTLNKKRTLALCSKLKKLGITFICITRADCIDREIAKGLQEAGCTQVDFGIETASPRLLSLINKNESPELMERAIRIVKEAGIKVKLFLMMGLPTETELDREFTLKFIARVKPDAYTLSRFRPIPGSSLEALDTPYWFYPDDDVEWRSYKERIEKILRE